MIDLLREELERLGLIIPVYILLALVLVVAGVFTEVPVFFLFLLLDASALLPLMAITADSVSAVYDRSNVFPSRKSWQVVVRYLLVSSFIAAGFLFGVLLMLGNAWYIGVLSVSQGLAYDLFFTAFIHIVPSLFLPVLYGFGYRRAALAFIAFLLLLLLGFMYFMPDVDFTSLSADVLWRMAGLVAVASLLLYFLSGVISAAVYRRKPSA